MHFANEKGIPTVTCMTIIHNKGFKQHIKTFIPISTEHHAWIAFTAGLNLLLGLATVDLITYDLIFLLINLLR